MKPINVVPGRSKYLGKQAYLGFGYGVWFQLKIITDKEWVS